MEAVAFDDAVVQADIVVTGEGRLDEQSEQGKVVSGVLRRAHGRPVVVCAGQVALAPDALRRLGIRAAVVTPTLDDLVRAGRAITRGDH